MHAVHESEENSVDFITDGSYFCENGVYTMSYMESNVTGMEGTQTTISFLPEEAVIDREGAITSRMVLRKGITNKILYETPFGSAHMEINTLGVVQNFSDAGGTAEINYIIGIQHRSFTEAKLVIRSEIQGEETDESYSGS